MSKTKVVLDSVIVYEYDVIKEAYTPYQLTVLTYGNHYLPNKTSLFYFDKDNMMWETRFELFTSFEKGYLHRVEYAMSGKIGEKQELDYNFEGDLVELREYKVDNKIKNRTEYNYVNGNLISDINYRVFSDSVEVIKSKNERFYDEMNRKTLSIKSQNSKNDSTWFYYNGESRIPNKISKAKYNYIITSINDRVSGISLGDNVEKGKQRHSDYDLTVKYSENGQLILMQHAQSKSSRVVKYKYNEQMNLSELMEANLDREDKYITKYKFNDYQKLNNFVFPPWYAFEIGVLTNEITFSLNEIVDDDNFEWLKDLGPQSLDDGTRILSVPHHDDTAYGFAPIQVNRAATKVRP